MKIAIAGGDLRQITAAEMLADTGYECHTFGLGDSFKPKNGTVIANDIQSALNGARAVILPLPCEKDGCLNAPFCKDKILLGEIIGSVGEDTLFIGGKLPKTLKNSIDFSVREDFQLRNAVPTAEGAVALAMELTDITLHGSNAAVVGYGRIGNYLANILKALGANVTVAARSTKARTQALMSSINAVGFESFEAPLKSADIVFNTVPNKIIGTAELKAMRAGTVIIDLASLPGGADENECSQYGIRLIRALGLPGKVAPKAAGSIVFETVSSILRERGIAP